MNDIFSPYRTITSKKDAYELAKPSETEIPSRKPGRHPPGHPGFLVFCGGYLRRAQMSTAPPAVASTELTLLVEGESTWSTTRPVYW